MKSWVEERAVLSDLELLTAHTLGDTFAFTDLIRRHYDYLWTVALRTSYSPEDAADSLQEALLSAHRTASAFRADSQVRSWLHRIVVNSCLDRIRRNRHHIAASIHDAGFSEPPVEHDPYDEVNSELTIAQALATLPPDQRAAVMAVDVEGYSVADAARLLGVPVGTIKSRCARGRLKLTTQLGFLREEGTDSP